MPDVVLPDERPTHNVGAVDFDWAAFRSACRRHGAKTIADCAKLTGVPQRTLYQMRRSPKGVSVGKLLQIRAATRISLDELYPCGREDAA